MTRLTRRTLLCTASTAVLMPSVTFAQKPMAGAPRPMAGGCTLWYRDPAKRWLDALPVGNGRLGAMQFGGLDTEILALNESTIWSGAPNSANNNPAFRERLDEIRQLMFAGKYAEANALCRTYLLGREENYGTHLAMAELTLKQPAPAAVRDYQRSLDLETGIARVDYMSGGVRYTREIFASNPDNVIVMRLTADRPGAIGFALGIDPKDLPGEVQVAPNELILHGSAWEKRQSTGRSGTIFQASVRVLADGGRVAPADKALRVEGADSVVLLIAANSNYRGEDFHKLCEAQIAAAAAKGYDALRTAHVADHRRLFSRVAIDLGGAAANKTPTDLRLKAVRAGTHDPHLSALFFQYGRYLLIAGSREDSPLPMNLQGIWNDSLAARMAWTCDFHLDINTQQNYWPSEVCNLSETAEPLFRLVETMSEHGRATARELYGAAGWVAHVYTNAWGFTASGRGLGWGPFVTGGVWAATHLWDHYRFTGDRVFLEKRAYPVFRGAAEFFLDYMVEDPKRGWLLTGPSISPENMFLAPDGQRCPLSMAPTCDVAFVADLFAACIEASVALGIDAAFRERLIAARAKLPPFQIGKRGQLQEWLEDFDEAVPNHRHTTHLVALYPLDQITPEGTPDLAKAARTTLALRLGQKDWEDVEWSRANLINFFARLQDGDEAHKHLLGLINEDTDTNMLTFSRAGIAGATENIFAIDGNTAGTAGVAEMLLQSHRGIHLLPALPSAWPTGSISGLRARGAFEVDLRWRRGVLTEATVKAISGGKTSVRYGQRSIDLDLRAGEQVRLNGQLRRA